MKTGDIFELAEVVRNLALRDGEKGLSTGEKQMYVKAKKILASELMYAKSMSEEEALAWLEETLTNGARPKAAAPEKKAAPAAKRAAPPKASPVAKKVAPAKPKAPRTTTAKTTTTSAAAKKPAAAAKKTTTAAKKPATTRKTTARA